MLPPVPQRWNNNSNNNNNNNNNNGIKDIKSYRNIVLCHRKRSPTGNNVIPPCGSRFDSGQINSLVDILWNFFSNVRWMSVNLGHICPRVSFNIINQISLLFYGWSLSCPDQGSNPGPLRDRRACYSMSHSGGLKHLLIIINIDSSYK